MAYIEDKDQQLGDQSNYAYDTAGDVTLQLWIPSGDIAVNPGINDQQAAWNSLDLLVDTIMRQFLAYFAGDAAMGGNTSNTTVFSLSKFRPYPEYTRIDGKFVTGDFNMHYRMAFA